MNEQPDRRLTILFGALVAIEFILAPLHAAGWLSPTVENALGALLLALCALVVITQPRRRIAVTAVALGGVIIGVVPHAGEDAAHVVELSTRVCVLAALSAVAAAAVFGPGRITTHRVLGSIALYLLVALFFSTAYAVISSVDPGAFSVAMPPWNPLYFSLVTITTTGYGDTTALSPAARSLVTLEAVFGQLYTATVIARLVTLELAHAVEKNVKR